MSAKVWKPWIGLTALACLLGSATVGFSAEEIKFGHVGAPGSLFAVCSEEFAKRANAKLGDKAKVVVFGSSQLGGDSELMKKLKLGTVDLALPSTVMSSVSDIFGIFEMPYLVKNRCHMKKIGEELFWKRIAPSVEEKGYKIIGLWENGFRHITNNSRPITVPEDLKGVKLRIPEGEWRVKMFKAYGANPTPMALSEVFVALQTGVVDGQENPFPQIFSQKFHEVQKYLSLTGHVYTPAYVTVGKAKWSKLPDEVRRVLETTAKEMQDFVYETAERLDTELLEKIKTSVRVNEVNKEAFIKASRPVYEEFGKAVKDGKELIDKALSLAQGC